MKHIIFFALFALSFNACKKENFGVRTYSGGTTTVKIGTWSTETVGNGKIVLDMDNGIFDFTAGSQNTRTQLYIRFDTLVTDKPTSYSFEKVQPLAWGDYWRETSSNLYYYSHDWGTGQIGSITIKTLDNDLIEGEYSFTATDVIEDFKTRTVKGTFSIPRE